MCDRRRPRLRYNRRPSGPGARGAFRFRRIRDLSRRRVADRAARRTRARHRRRERIQLFFRVTEAMKPNLSRLASNDRNIVRDVHPLRYSGAIRNLLIPSVCPAIPLEDANLCGPNSSKRNRHRLASDRVARRLDSVRRNSHQQFGRFEKSLALRNSPDSFFVGQHEDDFLGIVAVMTRLIFFFRNHLGLR